MFLLLESARSALGSINAHRFRAFLTSLGIIVGVGSIITLVAVINGLSAKVGELFQGLGSNNLAVTAFTSPEKLLRGQFARLVEDDLILLRNRLTGVSAITPVLFAQRNPSGTTYIAYGARDGYTRVIGTTHDYGRLSQLEAVQGRFLIYSDNVSRRRVGIIGESVRQRLQLPENPVGEYVSIGGEWIKVVGLMEPKGDAFGFDQDDYILLPYNTMQAIIGNQNETSMQILLNVEDVAASGEIRERVQRLLRTSHRLAPGEEDDFKIQSPEQLLVEFNDFIDSVTRFTIGIVSISLLVGGIGIMNIMLVTVKERTREIGVCIAIGAKRQHILLQFLLEALILCIAGGIVGILIGYLIGAGVAQLLGFPLSAIPLWSIVVSFAFAVFVGVAFGILPAAKAANLDPIEALRYE
jgi:putative ABC transport system permease protein